MKSTKTISVAIIFVSAILFSLYGFKGEKPKPKTTIVTETKCFVNQNMSVIKTYIESFSKCGYSVKQLISQSVSVSNGGLHTHADMRGDIILVLEKQTTVTVK